MVKAVEVVKHPKHQQPSGGSATRARPLMMPDTFSGDGKFDCKEHFENVSAVNSWTDDELLWLKVG